MHKRLEAKLLPLDIELERTLRNMEKEFNLEIKDK